MRNVIVGSLLFFALVAQACSGESGDSTFSPGGEDGGSSGSVPPGTFFPIDDSGVPDDAAPSDASNTRYASRVVR